jgi:disulfide bond formation protein DsbB
MILLGSIAAIGGAWFIEIGLGVKPCHLCLIGRLPHYFGIPIAMLTTWQVYTKGTSNWTKMLMVILSATYLIGAGIGGYHTGVEEHVFVGPTDCTGTIDKPVAIQDFLKQLDTVKIIRCDEVAMRIFGLSLAAWNGLICFGITFIAAIGANSRNQTHKN